jgi:hypothetical protein
MFKDFTEFFDERIRSPFYTYIAFSFVATNWQPLFYLLFADTSVASRFVYFNLHTNYVSLFIIPIFIGVLGGLASPYFSHWGAWWAEKPTKEKKLRQVKVALDIRQARSDMENIINQQVDSAIKSAMQDQEIAQIDDTDLRNRISEEVQKLRSEIYTGEQNNKNQINEHNQNARLKELKVLRGHYKDTRQFDKMETVDKDIEDILIANINTDS